MALPKASDHLIVSNAASPTSDWGRRPMRRASSLEVMGRHAVGSFFVPSATTFVWCQSATLGGAVAWGRPSCNDLQRLLAVFDGYRSARMSRHLSFIFDGRGIEAIDPDAFATLMAWLRARREELSGRVRVQFAVVAADSLLGATLAGILPVLGKTQDFCVVADPADAFRSLSVDGGVLYAEIERLVAEARGLPEELRRLRELLGARPEGPDLSTAARTMGVARRTLQRQLRKAGTTFRTEVRAARLFRARELLVAGREKIAVVARRVGLSGGALERLVREELSCTPSELRRVQGT
jgi:AraC-like DNA-binding protein